MAGIEQIVVHSKSYLVRWIQVPEEHSISWSVQPHKRSINFGIFKHPGTKNGVSPSLPTEETVESAAPGLGLTTVDSISKGGQQARRASVVSSSVVEKLQSLGYRSVAWTGKCDADKVSMGRYDVQEGDGGTYGLVFDNTFSKQTSKNVTFVLMTHLTNAPPKSGHHLHYAQAFSNASANSVGKGGGSPSVGPADSTESLSHHGALHRAILEDPRPNSKGGHGVESRGIEGTAFYTGILYKKRRRKGQGSAKRFFSLDFTSSTLSYYRDRHSSALRGAVPLSLAAVGVNEKTREFSIDSGAEVWHLKTTNKKDFEGWRDALERASGATAILEESAASKTPKAALVPWKVDTQDVREWERVEQLVSQVSGTRDAVRGLAKDTDPKYLMGSYASSLGVTAAAGHNSAMSPIRPENQNPFFADGDDKEPPKRPFWKRKSSSERSTAVLVRRSVSTQLAVPSPSLVGGSMPPPGNSLQVPRHSSVPSQSSSADTTEVHQRCMALLSDLDNVVADFSALIAQSKRRRLPPLPKSTSRLSIDSIDGYEEFFDADDGGANTSQLLTIRRSSEHIGQDEQLFDHNSDADSDTSSDIGDGPAGAVTFNGARSASQQHLLSSKPDTLSPLPLPPVKRRTAIPPPKQPPPSIIGFLRKNAGKDLSTTSMPVTANEPTSLLQRLAESVEYPQLLDSAASTAVSPVERLMYVTAFAISYFANNRVKERAIRKPFNPMLGETFELVREDLGFRFIAEKVSHHPVRMACQAESLNNGGWCFAQSPKPEQKFWGKSMELNTEGKAHVILHAPDEHYSWDQATCVLRNMIAGEKYVEPVQTMTIRNDTNGMHAVVSFKAGGMFSGRSEEVGVEFFDDPSPEAPLPLGLTGKWTESLKRTDTGATIWTVGALVPNSAKVYGLTAFAATLNEVTEIEKGHLPPTDSRLRPDQRALEEGDVDKAEALKARLEERQRGRRKVLESHGQQWKPQFFEKVEAVEGSDEEVWMLVRQRGYWDRRAAGDWSRVEEVFET